jgi:hypothetical protein
VGGPLALPLALLLEGPVSIVLATCSEDLVPDLVQAIGCRVLADGRVVVIVSADQAEGLVESLEAGRPLAATFSLPTTHRTVQLKATRAELAPARRADREAVERYRRAFGEELARVGFGGAYAQAIVDAEPSGLLAVTFTPTAAFDQTPGPRAGHALDPGEERG